MARKKTNKDKGAAKENGNLRMYQYTGRSLSPLAKCKDDCDEGNIEKVARNTLRTKKLTSELTGILVVLTHPAPACFHFGFARNDLGQGDRFFHLLQLRSYAKY